MVVDFACSSPLESVLFAGKGAMATRFVRVWKDIPDEVRSASLGVTEVY